MTHADNAALSPDLLEAARALGSATLHEAGGKKGALPSAIKPLRNDWRIAATAFVVVGPACDNLWLHRAIYAAPTGSVLVHACGAHDEAGYWGGIMANAARACGLAGFVTEGGVRDSEELRKLDWPVFAANVCIQGTTKRPDGAGSIGQSVMIGGVLVQTGDLLVADADGVVVIARADAQRVITAGVQREKDELAIVERLLKGERTLDIYQLPPQA
jgi:4-hydroxy-4-methyl-2-oxoglutarate aldolase